MTSSSGLSRSFACQIIVLACLLFVSTAAAAPPKIISFSPASGSPGVAVTITGEGFAISAASNVVYFGAARASVVSASAQQLTVTVPKGATVAPISVRVSDLTAMAAKPFLPTFNGDGSPINAATLGDRFDLVAGSGPTPVVLADMDMDGKTDIVVGNGLSHSVWVFRNTGESGNLGTASFATPVGIALPATTQDDPYKITAADLDNDGRVDLIVAGVELGRITILRNVHQGGAFSSESFSPPMHVQIGTECRFARAADLDADGRADLLAADFKANTVALLKNISSPGNIAFGSGVNLAAGGGPYELDVGDLDRDGLLDFAVMNYFSGLSVFRNLGLSETFATNAFERTDFPAPEQGHTIVIGDVDLDGKLDLVAGSVSASISLWRNVSSPGEFNTNSLMSRVDFTTGHWTHTVQLADLNGDGKPDVITVGELDSYMSAFENQSLPGELRLGERVDFGAGWNPWCIAAGDLDADDRPDVVFANHWGGTVTVYRNTSGIRGPPSILVQPADASVRAGQTATFSVAAGGSAPLTFQWSHSSKVLADATNSVLTLTNVQAAQAGAYAVTVSNQLGWIQSSNAVLTVQPPRPAVVVGSYTNVSGWPFTVPVSVLANGNENALSFSLNFGSSGRVTYAGASAGAVVENSMLVVNTNQLNQGRIGIAIALPANTALPAGRQVILTLRFNTTPWLESGPLTQPISFVDLPIAREMVDKQAQPLEAIYNGGELTLLPTALEADTAPRPNGNLSLTLSDWVQAGRFVAGIEEPTPGGEFQRVDSAPRDSYGDGVLKVTDWVQAGRYFGGLDPSAPVGGPSARGPQAAQAAADSQPMNGPGLRRVSVGAATGATGNTVVLPITLHAQGDENALGFSLSFDPALLKYESISQGPGSAGASLNIHTGMAAAGRIGVVIALPTGGVFPAGDHVLLHTQISRMAALSEGGALFGFSDQPVPKVVSDINAGELPTEYAGVSIEALLRPSLTVSRSQDMIRISWPSSAEGYILESATEIGGVWQQVSEAAQTDGAARVISLPSTNAHRLFRLKLK